MSTRKIWKLTMPVTDSPMTFQMPPNAQIVKVSTRNPDVIDLHFLFLTPNPDQRQRVDRTFVTHGTGHEIPDESGKYVGTAIAPLGLVWHVFEVTA